MYHGVESRSRLAYRPAVEFTCSLLLDNSLGNGPEHEKPKAFGLLRVNGNARLVLPAPSLTKLPGGLGSHFPHNKAEVAKPENRRLHAHPEPLLEP